MLRAFLLALFILCIAIPAYGQSFEVKAISQDLQEVVLCDRDTGTEWLGRLGEEVEGWRIIEINEAHISLSKLGDDGTVLVTRVPVLVERKLTIDRTE